MTTCMLDSQARLHLYAGRLTVKRPELANSYLPLSQIERVVIRATHDPTLQALLMLAEAGRPVHFINASGEPVATLTPHNAAPSPQTVGERLTSGLFRNSGANSYRTWLENQRSHACSRLIRHSSARDWKRVDAAVTRNLNRVITNKALLRTLLGELRGLLWAWLDARFQRLGLHDVAEVLEGRGCRFQSELETLLSLPLKSWLTTVLRETPNAALDPGQLFQRFENRLDSRLWLHINAMNSTLTRPRAARRRTSSRTKDGGDGG